MEIQIFDESHPQTINSVKVMGDLRGLKYSEDTDTLWMRVRPLSLTPSESMPSGLPYVIQPLRTALYRGILHVGGAG
jgi:hypothetical protein